MDSAGNISKHFYVVSVHSKHVVQHVRLEVDGTSFMVVEHVEGDAAGRGASVHEEPDCQTDGSAMPLLLVGLHAERSP